MLSQERVSACEAAVLREEATYIERHHRCREVVGTMAESMPGGDTRSIVWFDPFPPVMDRGEGYEMYDLDGNRFLDFLGNYSSLVHGHQPAFVVEAVKTELDRGFVFAAPVWEQAVLASMLTERLPAADLVRFTNSGTEAVWLAVRLARAATGRERIAVAAHSYHGSGDEAAWAMSKKTGTAVFPINSIDETRRVLDAARPLAAVLIEPVLGVGGVIPLQQEYLAFLREYTRERGTVLIFDEVMTFRLSYGGMQGSLSVRPDLTVLGKVIGGGLPIGAVAGVREIMELSDPRRSAALHHAGTNNGHRLAMVAGAAAVKALDLKAIERINQLGAKLADAVRLEAKRAGVPVSVTSCGSMLGLHAASAVTTPEQAHVARGSVFARYLHLALTNRGIFLAPRGQMCISTAMDEGVVELARSAIAGVFRDIARSGLS